MVEEAAVLVVRYNEHRPRPSLRIVREPLIDLRKKDFARCYRERRVVVTRLMKMHWAIVIVWFDEYDLRPIVWVLVSEVTRQLSEPPKVACQEEW